jgi:hypothetical protein
MHENLRDLHKIKLCYENRTSHPLGGDGPYELILLFASLFTTPFTRQSFLHAFLLARFEIKGMSLDFLDNVFLLYLPLKAAQGVFERFSLLQSHFCQRNYTPKLVQMGPVFIARFYPQVKRYCDRGTAWRGSDQDPKTTGRSPTPKSELPGKTRVRRASLKFTGNLTANNKTFFYQLVECGKTS